MPTPSLLFIPSCDCYEALRRERTGRWLHNTRKKNLDGTDGIKNNAIRRWRKKIEIDWERGREREKESEAGKRRKWRNGNMEETMSLLKQAMWPLARS